MNSLDADLLGLLRSAFGVEVDEAAAIVDAGDECRLWHVLAPRSLVVRVAPPWRSTDELRWAYRVAAALGAHVPEVVLPLSPIVARWRDRPVTVWPHVAGRRLDRDSAVDRRAAAQLLARLHQAAVAIDDPGPRPVSAAGGPADWPTGAERADIEDPDLDTTLASWRSGTGATAPRRPVHGDFYRRNIHVTGSGALRLLDWDDARIDVLVSELAWSVWEFAHRRHELDMDRAVRFLLDYRAAGGPGYDVEVIVPFIRDRLRTEILRSRSARAAGQYFDPNYEANEVKAFEGLRDLRLPL